VQIEPDERLARDKKENGRDTEQRQREIPFEAEGVTNPLVVALAEKLRAAK